MQQLNLEQIKQIAFGVANVKEADGKMVFNRFTEEQQELYKTVSDDFYMKSFSTSGVSSKLVSLELDDGAYVSPITKDLTMLVIRESV